MRSHDLIDAILDGDTGKVRRLLEEGANVNATFDHGRSPLMIAVGSVEREPQIVRLLLERGADIWHVSESGHNAMHEVVAVAGQEGREREREEIVRLLVKAETPMEHRDHRGLTPFQRAILEGTPEDARCLLRHGADANARVEGEGEVQTLDVCKAAIEYPHILIKLVPHVCVDVDALHQYARAQLAEREGEARNAIQKSVDFMERPLAPFFDYTRSSLVEAAHLGDVAGVRSALSEGVSVHKGGFFIASGWSENVYTPLQAAVVSPKANQRVIDILLRAGAAIDGEGGGTPPLYMALQNGSIDHAYHLLKRGANPWHPYGNIFQHVYEPRILRRVLASNPPPSVLTEAILVTGGPFAYRRVVPALLRAGVDPNHRFADGTTFLHRTHAPDTIRALVKAGADLEAIHEPTEVEPEGPFFSPCPSFGWTPLGAQVMGAWSGPPDWRGPCELIRLGANVNFVHASGFPLFLLAFNRSDVFPETVKALLQAGADPIVTWRGQNAFHFLPAYLEEEYFFPVFDILLEGGVPIDGRDDEDITPLFRAVRNDGHPLVQRLLESGADPNLPCAGAPPLSAARSPEVISLLLAAGADPRAQDSEGRTTLDHLREALLEFEKLGPLPFDEKDTSSSIYELIEAHDGPEQAQEWMNNGYFDRRDELLKSIAILEAAIKH